MKKILNSRGFAGFLIGFGIWVVITLLIYTEILPRSMQSLAIKICYFVILTLSLDLVVGYLGELSLGHAAFYAVGAYAGCAFAVYTGLPVIPRFLLALAVGGISAAIVGFLISCAIIKLRGDYLAIVTLAFGEFIRSFVKIIPGLGGTKGLNGIPGFENRTENFAAAYIVVALVILIIYNFTKSRYGRAVTAIRDNVIAAESIGIDVKRMKVLVFTVSAFMAGMAGVLFGVYKTNINPSDFTYNVSIEVLVVVVLGGMGSIKGSIIASIVIVALPELLRGTAKYRLLIYAVALIAMMMINSSPRLIALKEKVSKKLGDVSAAVKIKLRGAK